MFNVTKPPTDFYYQGGEDDPHAADWLTGTWLEEQLNGQRHLAGLINTLESFRLNRIRICDKKQTQFRKCTF